MKFTFLIFLLLIFTISLSIAQPTLDDEINEFQTGKCYYSKIDTSQARGDCVKYFEFKALPKIQTFDTITIKEAYPFKTSPSDFYDSIIHIEVFSGFEKPVFRKFDECLDHYKLERSEFILICLVEVPARYETITIKKLKSEVLRQPNKDFSQTTEQETIIVKKVKPAHRQHQWVEISKDEANKRSKWDIATLKVGKWEEWREAHSHQCSSYKNDVILTIKKIQISLNNKGYACPIDGVLGEETKKALLRFQKANDLPQGRLDVETLKKLGVYD